MKKIQSLKGKKAFSEVFKKGRRYRIAQMELIVLKEIFNKKSKEEGIKVNQSSLNGIYAGIQVSRKFGNAVARNKVKRQIRAVLNELFRKNTSEIYIIIRPNSFKKSRSFTELRNNIAALLYKAGLNA